MRFFFNTVGWVYIQGRVGSYVNIALKLVKRFVKFMKDFYQERVVNKED